MNVVFPYLKKIGLLWVTEHIIPAQEHFSSNIIMHKLLLKIDSLNSVRNPNGKRVLLFTPVNEHHEIPILFIQYLLKKYGHTVIYFGVSIKLYDIEEYCAFKTVDVLHFHVITNLNGLPINDYVTNIANKFPSQKIIISGPVAAEVTITKQNTRHLVNMKQLLDYVKE
ncbi:MAG: cobalamin B12-binding domain-containing protein [Chitinophagaceae bacterium]|nr:cobalamin B12-binding domain-containing protein [Chitinophagaceae bacterium]